MIWNEIRAAIDRSTTFCLSSHQSQDGDCIGSQLAFFWYLRSLGKKVYIFNQDPVPSKFRFLKDCDQISQKIPEEPIDVLFVLDSSNLQRLGWDITKLKGSPMIIDIDHHRDNSHFGALNHIDVKAAATGEIIYQLFADNGIEYPKEVAEALYTAILTDTGGFRFSNTNSRILRTCADLADRGAHCSQIYDRVYASHPQRALLLQSKIWSTLKFHINGKICTMELPLALLDQIGAVYSDSEGMADYAITAECVEVGFLAKHTEKETHFSLRSKGRIDVGRIAQTIPGGGGHGCAAGCTLPLPYEQALEYMLSIISKELQ